MISAQMMVLLSVAFFAIASAGCDNKCSGHGTCLIHGVCDCFDNWGMNHGRDSGDCSERTCPFELAWVDKPDALGNHHGYTECASRGICDRSTGECTCFPGYEGKGCQRTVCPNDCSGHGQCTFIEDFGFYDTRTEYPSANTFQNYEQDRINFAYYGWDEGKTRGCLCDPEWTDADCSKRICPYGNDVLDIRSDISDSVQYEVQQIKFRSSTATGGNDPSSQAQCDGLNGKTFSIGFMDRQNQMFWTDPIEYVEAHVGSAPLFSTSRYTPCNQLVANIKKQLLGLPTNPIDDVTISADCGTTDPALGYLTKRGCLSLINITFTGSSVQGLQNMLQVDVRTCADGCHPKLSGLEVWPDSVIVQRIAAPDYNTYSCGNRGKCDYNTGICECFDGFTGPSCSVMTALV